MQFNPTFILKVWGLRLILMKYKKESFAIFFIILFFTANVSGAFPSKNDYVGAEICKKCHERTDIFSSGGAQKECEKLAINLLGEIPLDIDIRIGGDEGIPIVEKDSVNPQSKAFLEIAQRVINNI